MWFMGSQQILHISSYPQTTCATLSVFFQLVWVCYSFMYSFLHLSLHTIVVVFFSQIRWGNLDDGGYDEQQIKENWVTVLLFALS